MQSNIIQIRNLFHIFNQNNIGRSKVVLNDINLDLNKYKTICIIGPSGSGKTTLLRIIAGKLSPSSGSFYYLGEKINSTRSLVKFLQSKVTIIPQNPLHILFPNLTVKENLNLLASVNSRKFEKLAKNEKTKLISENLNDLEINHLINKQILKLSGGEIQRVVIVLALIKRSEILLFDEPTAFLNEDLHQQIANLIKQTTMKYGLTSVVTTHSTIFSNKIGNFIELFDGSFREIGKQLNSKYKTEISDVNIVLNTNRILIPSNFLKLIEAKRILNLNLEGKKIIIKSDDIEL